MLLVGRPKYPTEDDLERVAEIEAGSAGRTWTKGRRSFSAGLRGLISVSCLAV
jgi:hypothetical protein